MRQSEEEYNKQTDAEQHNDYAAGITQDPLHKPHTIGMTEVH